MFAYLAFKGLSWCEVSRTLFSPIIYTAWDKAMTPWGEFFYLEANADQLDCGYGIFASIPKEAKRYALEIYLVAPDPRYRLAIGMLGWRAEAAMVVAPVISEEGAAKQVLSAYHAGYPQVPGVLAWAARHAPPEEGFRILQDILNNYQDEEVLLTIADSAVAIGKDGVPILEQLTRNQKARVWMRVIDNCKQPVEYARRILSAHRAGYPQVPGVLAWAARYASPEEGVSILQNILNSPQDERILQIVADSAAFMGKEGVPILDRLIRGEYQKISPRP